MSVSPFKCFSMEVCVPVHGVVLRGETRVADKLVSAHPFHAVRTMILQYNCFERLVQLHRVLILLQLKWGRL